MIVCSSDECVHSLEDDIVVILERMRVCLENRSLLFI